MRLDGFRWSLLGIGIFCLILPAVFPSPSAWSAAKESKRLLGGFDPIGCRRCDDASVAWDERTCTAGACACPTGFVSVEIAPGICDEVVEDPLWTCDTKEDSIFKREYTGLCPGGGPTCDQDVCIITETSIPLPFIECFDWQIRP